MSQTPSPLAALIPHQGSMCLLERVVDWNDQRITLATDTHRTHDNPLRSQGELKAVHLCEYGAQAMAVHGALQAQAKGSTAPPGMLVALRSVKFNCERVDTIESSLVIEAECLQSSPTSQQYTFKVSANDQLLCEGRAAVVLRG